MANNQKQVSDEDQLKGQRSQEENDRDEQYNSDVSSKGIDKNSNFGTIDDSESSEGMNEMDDEE